MKLEKIETLDGLRGFAALLVLWAHFPILHGSIGSFSKLLSTYTYAGYIGVDIFFALSGFLITRILLTEKQEGHLSFKRFYLKRSLRIFPIYYLSILFVGIIISWQHLGWVAAYTSNYFFSFNHDPNPMRHTWSLCVEEHFYLFWPFIISFCNQGASKRIISIIIPVGVIIVAILTVLFMEEQIGKDMMYRVTHFRILTLALGSSIAFYEPTVKLLPRRYLRYLLITLIAILVFMRTYYHIDILENLPSHIIELIVFSLFSALLVILIIRLNYTIKSFWTYMFTNPIITYCGKISYGIYLYHFPILFFLGLTEDQQTGNTTVVMWLTALALCFIIPMLSYAAIEQPLLKMKDKLKS